MTPEDLARYDRLQARMDLIEQSLAMTIGKRKAQAAAWGAWLVAIQHGVKRGLIRLAADSKLDLGTATRNVGLIDNEVEVMLRGFHGKLCEFLQVDHEEARKLAKHFEQVIRDILDEKG